MTTVTHPDERTLREVIRRIVDVAQPERIILFGSAARGEMDRHSDLDLLVVTPDMSDRREMLNRIYDRLYGVAIAVDVILVTPEEVERYRDTHCLVIKPALREGREVYRAGIDPLPAE